MQEQPTTRRRFQSLVRKILDQNPSKTKLSTSRIIPIDLSSNPSQVNENRQSHSSSVNTSGFQRKSTIGKYWQSIVGSKDKEDSELNNSKLDTSTGKRKGNNKLHSLVSSFIKNRKKTNTFIPDLPKDLGPEVVKRKFHRAFHILRSLHRLNRISGDIQLFGTSSNLFDLTTRDRIRVKKILYPSVLDEAEQHLREERDMKWFVLHPKGRTRIVWSLVMVFLLIYTATIMPYRLTFEEITPASWQVVDYFVDALFLIDFLMNFISAYYDEEGHFVKEPKTLALKYLKSWFILDLIAVFPLDIIENVVIDNDTNSSKVRYNFFLRLIRIPRLYRLVKIVKLNSLFKFIRGNKALEWLELNSILMKLASFFVIVVTVVHIMACLWYFVARIDNNDPDTWIARNGFDRSPNSSVYLASLYYVISTLATVGYGDIYSETIPEKILTIIWMILGVGFYSFTVGMIASIFSSRENRESSLKRKISIANEFAKEIKAPKSLKARIRKILEYNSLRNCFSWANKKDIFSEIPISLRYEIIMAMHGGILGTIPFFREHSDKYFVVTIAEILKPLQVAARDFLWKEGDSAESIYFLITGKVHLLSSEFLTPEDRVKNQKTSIIFKRYMGGSYFGEVELIFKRKRGYTLQASSHAELFYITKHDYFNILLTEFPHIHEEFKEIALARDKHDGVSLAEIRSFLFAHIPEERRSSRNLLRSRQSSLAQPQRSSQNSLSQPQRSNSTSSSRLKATLTHMPSLDAYVNTNINPLPIKSTDEIRIPEIATPTNHTNKPPVNNFLPEVKLNNLLSPTHSPKVQNTSLSEKRHSYTSLHNMAQLDKLSPVLKGQTPSDDQSPRMDTSWSPTSLPKGSSATSSDSSSDSSDSSDSSSDSKPVSKLSLYPVSPTPASPVHSDKYQERRRSANPFFSPSPKKLVEHPNSAKFHRSNSSLATPIIKDTGTRRGSIRISSALKPGAVISSVPRKGQRKRTKEISFLKMAAGVETEEDSSPDTRGSKPSAEKRVKEEVSHEVKKPPLSGSNQNSQRTERKSKEEKKKSGFFNQSRNTRRRRDTEEASNLKNTIKDSNKRMENLENRFQDAMNALEGLMNME